MLNNFLCKIDSSLLAILIVNIVLIAAVVALFIWYGVKKRKAKAPVREERVERLNDEVVPEEAPVVEGPKVYEDDNAVLHFVNQITDINTEANTELNSTAVIVNHEVEQHTKKAVDKQAINNFVEIGGEKKTVTTEEKVASFNRGTNAFQNATNFVNTIKTEQTVVEEPVAPKAAPKAAAPKTTKAAPKTAAKTTTARKTTTKK